MLLEAIKSKCPCMVDVSEDEFKSIWSSFIRFLSNITCWDIQGGTILKECRTQSIKLDKALCSYSCIDVYPYWKNIDLDTVSVELRQYSSRGVDIIPIDKSLFSYDDISDKFYIRLNELTASSTECNKNCLNNVIIMSYTAGYDLTTEEWQDLICHYLTGYQAIRNNCTSVNDCSSIHRLAVGAVLSKKTVDTINYEWDIDQQSQEVFFKQLVGNFYIDYLGRYALCGRDYDISQNIYVGKGDNYVNKI